MSSNVWFIGDLHFGHRAILEYCNRPFESLFEMQEALIDNWNKVVKKDDKVFVLGDFALCGKDKIIEIGQRLSGKKILVMGNHDGAALSTYYKAGFEMVSKYPILFNDFYILSHKPKYIQPEGLYCNFYAHVHDDPRYETVTNRTYCMSVERINYTPINYEDVTLQMANHIAEKIF